jgi:predicted kinase
VRPEPGPPPAVLLTGSPAAGKSTVGRALARRLRAALVDQDTATAPLVAVVADLVGVDDLDDRRLAGPTRGARYEAVTALAEDNLRIGTPVVLVAPFTSERRDLGA